MIDLNSLRSLKDEFGEIDAYYLEERTMKIMRFPFFIVLISMLVFMPFAAAQIEQDGLVNIAVEVSDNVVQVPVSVAANVCGIDAAVLVAEFVGTDKVACVIDQETAAEHNIEY